jgi:hypothetical protein
VVYDPVIKQKCFAFDALIERKGPVPKELKCAHLNNNFPTQFAKFNDDKIVIDRNQCHQGPNNMKANDCRSPKFKCHLRKGKERWCTLYIVYILSDLYMYTPKEAINTHLNVPESGSYSMHTL